MSGDHLPPDRFNPGPLVPREIHIWSFPVFEYRNWADSHQHILSERELEKARRFYREEDRIRSRVVYVLLRQILSLYTGMPPAVIPILPDEKGKPYMEGGNAPLFNFSHSGDRALYVFSPDRPVGADVEEEKECRDLDGLVEMCCSPGETALLEKIPPDERAGLFYRFWSFKEAYLKGTGTGITVPLKEIDSSAGDRIGEWTVKSLNCWPGYSAAAAVRDENPRLIVITG